MSQKRGVSSLAYVLTAVGILGIIFSLVTEQSDYDAVAFGIATISILIAIAGLALAFKVPVGTDQPKEGSQGNPTIAIPSSLALNQSRPFRTPQLQSPSPL